MEPQPETCSAYNPPTIIYNVVAYGDAEAFVVYSSTSEQLAISRAKLIAATNHNQPQPTTTDRNYRNHETPT